MVAAPGNSRYEIFQLNEKGLPLRHHADYSVGRSQIGRGFAHAPLGTNETNFPGAAAADSVHQRLFVSDNSDLQAQPGARIMVFDIDPDSLVRRGRGKLPEAIAVLGQPDEMTWDLGSGPAKIGGSGALIVDEERQLLFFADRANHRVLVWDIDPGRFETGMEAIAVLGQPDFYANQPGMSQAALHSPMSLTYDPTEKHLYVMDAGNRRVMVFDVSDRQLDRKTGFTAFASIGHSTGHASTGSRTRSPARPSPSPAISPRATSGAPFPIE